MVPPVLNVLLVEDNRLDAVVVLRCLEESARDAFAIEQTDCLAAARSRLAAGGIDVVLLDLNLPDSMGIATLSALLSADVAVPVVVLTHISDLDLSLEAIRKGAEDYLFKDEITGPLVRRTLRHSVERFRTRQSMLEKDAQLRLMTDEFQLARRIQEGMHPRPLPAQFGFDVGGCCYSADATGGDFFDYVALADGTLGIVLGDASGHGLGSALVAAMTQASLRTMARLDEPVDLGAMLSACNELLCDETGDERFVTVLLASLAPRSHLLLYTSAGHPPGLVVSSAQRLKAILPSTDVPLGILQHASFPLGEALLLDPGDTLIFATDGLLEAMCEERELFGPRRVMELVFGETALGAQQLATRLCQAAREFGGLPQQDDITAVVVKI